MTFDLLVRGGTAVLPTGPRPVDIAVAGGRIAAIEDPGVVRGDTAQRVADADGLLVLPGVIDVHTHTRIPSEEEPTRFFQDSVAAAFGGTTTFLSFNNPGTGISAEAQRTLRGGIDEWLARTAGESVIDYGLSAVITAQQDDPLGHLQHAIGRGVPTFKAFMVYEFGIDPARLAPMLGQVARAGGMLELHCEDRSSLDRGIAALVANGRTRPGDHAASRPTGVEADGTAQAVGWAVTENAPLYVVHLSCADALAPAAAAKKAGASVYVETCPHFLTQDASQYEASDEEAIRFVVSPPFRRVRDRDALWAGLADGTVDVVATDHVPDRLTVEKRYTGQPFTEISNGAPGIETLLTVVYSEGVATGRITLQRMSEILSATPARLFGMPDKGAIEIGRDADLVLFDPFARRTIRAEDLHHTSDYTPYEGMSVQGAVRAVLLRGEEVIRDGELVAGRGVGRYLERRLTAGT
ncbi:MAG: dihydropyrimidinase [Chloroflexota bacterium]|nr:dihydropyrimidinase [Chloroflexota bacterium]